MVCHEYGRADGIRQAGIATFQTVRQVTQSDGKNYQENSKFGPGLVLTVKSGRLKDLE